MARAAKAARTITAKVVRQPHRPPTRAPKGTPVNKAVVSPAVTMDR